MIRSCNAAKSNDQESKFRLAFHVIIKRDSRVRETPNINSYNSKLTFARQSAILE